MKSLIIGIQKILRLFTRFLKKCQEIGSRSSIYGMRLAGREAKGLYTRVSNIGFTKSFTILIPLHLD